MLKQLFITIAIACTVVAAGWMYIEYDSARKIKHAEGDVNYNLPSQKETDETKEQAPQVYTSSPDVYGMISVSSPTANTQITSPLTIQGEAQGNWFFEASAPVTLVDTEGKVIAQGYIQAQEDWMTTDKVPFIGTLTFVKPGYGTRGFLILRKDNPSGEAQFDRSMQIPVRF